MNRVYTEVEAEGKYVANCLTARELNFIKLANSTIGQLANSTIGELANSTIGELANSTIGELANLTMGELANSTIGELANSTIGELENLTIGDTIHRNLQYSLEPEFLDVSEVNHASGDIHRLSVLPMAVIVAMACGGLVILAKWLCSVFRESSEFRELQWADKK